MLKLLQIKPINCRTLLIGYNAGKELEKRFINVWQAHKP